MQTSNRPSSRYKRDPKRIDKIFNSDGLRTLIGKANLLIRIGNCLIDVIPPQFVAYIRVMNIEGNTLTLESSNAACITQLRFHEADILASIRRVIPKLDYLQYVKYHVRSPRAAKSLQAGRRANLSAKSSQLIGEAAQGVENPELRAALERLAGMRD